MQTSSFGIAAALLALTTATALAQPPKTPDPPRPAAVFDPAAIRKQAAQMAEFRVLLSDPDPNVRLLTMQEAMRSGDAVMREMATEAGLASSESAIINVALTGLLANVQQIVLENVDKDGKLTTPGSRASVVLHVKVFDQDTGKISGIVDTRTSDSTWSGQIKGNVLSFSTTNGSWSGALLWSAETGDFRGRINPNSGRQDGLATVVWKVR